MVSALNGNDNTGYSENAEQTDAAEFEKVVRSRRSVRRFTPEAIPDSIVHKCLDLALLAPNSSNLQAWEFYYVKSPEKRKLLDAACLSQPAATTAPVIIVVVAKLNTWSQNAKQMLATLRSSALPAPRSALDYYGKLVPLVYAQGPWGVFGLAKKLILNIIGLFKPMPRGPSSIADMRVWSHKSAALACENLMLAFRAYGYDTCPMEGLDSSRVKSILGLGRGSEIVMAISAGKRASGGIYGPRLRFERSRFVFEV